MRDKLFEQGLKLRKRVLGAAYVDKQLRTADAFTMPMQMLATKSAWGMVWSRPGLPRRIRSMLNIAMLVALGTRALVARPAKTTAPGHASLDIARAPLQPAASQACCGELAESCCTIARACRTSCSY